MSDFLAKLETFPDLEVSIIRATKINKVLKAILKLEAIPKEEEFKFKPRSHALLEKWNKTLSTNETSAPTSAPANGVNGNGSAIPPALKADPHQRAQSSAVAKDAPKESDSQTAPSNGDKEELNERLGKLVKAA